MLKLKFFVLLVAFLISPSSFAMHMDLALPALCYHYVHCIYPPSCDPVAVESNVSLVDKALKQLAATELVGNETFRAFVDKTAQQKETGARLFSYVTAMGHNKQNFDQRLAELSTGSAVTESELAALGTNLNLNRTQAILVATRMVEALSSVGNQIP